jgi:hypothetical protein
VVIQHTEVECGCFTIGANTTALSLRELRQRDAEQRRALAKLPYIGRKMVKPFSLEEIAATPPAESVVVTRD